MRLRVIKEAPISGWRLESSQNDAERIKTNIEGVARLAPSSPAVLPANPIIGIMRLGRELILLSGAQIGSAPTNKKSNDQHSY